MNALSARLLALMALVLGAVHRRCWGGSCPRWLAVLIGLAGSAALILTVMPWPSDWPRWLAIAAAIIIHAQAYNLPGHGESMDMGTMGGTARSDFRAMAIRYVIAAIAVASLLVLAGADLWICFFPVTGPLIALGYLLAWKHLDRNQTVVGECVLGALWYGGLTLALA